jgi:Na+/H+ antiporter NhaC
MSPYALYISAIPYNYYSIILVLCSILVSIRNIAPIRILQPAYKRLDESPEHQHEEAGHQHTFSEKAPPKILNLLIPLAVLIAAILYLLWDSGISNGAKSLGEAFIMATYSGAILGGTLVALIVTVVIYSIQKVPVKAMESAFFSGGMELLPPILIVILSWAIAALAQDLGFYYEIAALFNMYLVPQVTPLAFFVVSALTSYVIGSSWATWALLIPVGLSIGAANGIHIPLLLGAIFAGGSVGDSISPLGETPVLTASVFEISIYQHIRYVFPYGLIAAGISAAAYLTAGIL